MLAKGEIVEHYLPGARNESKPCCGAAETIQIEVSRAGGEAVRLSGNQYLIPQQVLGRNQPYYGDAEIVKDVLEMGRSGMSAVDFMEQRAYRESLAAPAPPPATPESVKTFKVPHWEAVSLAGLNTGADELLPTLSEDARFIAFERRRGGAVTIAVYDAANARVVEGGAGEGPAISGDGKTLVWLNSGNIELGEISNGAITWRKRAITAFGNMKAVGGPRLSRNGRWMAWVKLFHYFERGASHSGSNGGETGVLILSLHQRRRRPRPLAPQSCLRCEKGSRSRRVWRE